MFRIVSKRAQTLLEYSIILGVIVGIFITLNTLIKRNVQGMIKTAADQIGTQENAEQDFNEITGYMLGSYLKADSVTSKISREGQDPGLTNIIFDDYSSVYTQTNSLLGTISNVE